ncbi:hypothetical protein SEUCBS140593_007149 [Sporothrix eucalyptigena]|uniref:Vacuolar sorting protein Vps3844 C-terminal domain-containing protein n=1 Tax=Sporothrix eucalyptigena TaxID=1812306 RepID=A0ABP0CAU0_9PEZI
MKFLAGLAVAASLASSVAAAAASAPVYLIRSSSTSSSTDAKDATTASPDLPRQIARQILLQRLHASDGSSFFDTLPRNYDPETALDLIQQFAGKTTPVLFADDDSKTRRPLELLVAIQGAKPEHAAALEAVLPKAFAKPAFSVADLPSEAANTRLFVDELSGEGIVAHQETSVTEAMAEGVPESWANGVFVGLYDAKKDTKTVDTLISALPQIVAMAQNGDLDASILLLPESSRFAQWKHWASSKGLKPAGAKILPPKATAVPNNELRIREADSELVMAEETDKVDTIVKNDGDSKDDKPAPIPACFQSFNSCMAATNSCSSHGTCVDKYAGGTLNDRDVKSNKANAGSCYACQCQLTFNRPLNDSNSKGISTSSWGGNMCQKKDVSAPFWLITGFSVAIVGIISFAIGLLFSVGEEKLPGVIGAGVSRTK